jgi:hypothetical protein
MWAWGRLQCKVKKRSHLESFALTLPMSACGGARAQSLYGRKRLQFSGY